MTLTPDRMFRRRALLFSGLVAGVMVLGLAACVHSAVPGMPLGETPGISGNPPVPYARPGQTLPMQAVRDLVFETREGSMLSLDLSPDGKTLVFDMLGDLYMLPVDGGRARRVTSGMAMDSQPVWSPDGKDVLFVSDRSGAENLWLMDAAGENLRQISLYDGNPVFVSPEWAPDGQSIVVTRFWADRNAYELWRFRPVPGNMGEVLRSTRAPGATESDISSLGARFSPDGKAIYMASLSGADPLFNDISPWSIVRKDVATGAEDVILPAGKDGPSTVPRFRPAVTPDGMSLVYGERRGGVTRLMVAPVDGGEAREIGEIDPDAVLAALTNDAISRFDFTPDGRGVLINREGRIDILPLDGGEVAAVPFTAEIRQALGPLGRHQAVIEEGPLRARLIQAPDLSPDGRRIAFSSLGEIYVQPVEAGAAPVRLRADGVSGYHPAWSPDGRQIASVSWNREEGGAIWISSVEGGEHQRADDGSAFYTHPVFTPAGDALIAVRSPTTGRLETYKEYGQWREAELVRIPLDGSGVQVLASGEIGGQPHFSGTPGEVLFNSDAGIEAVSLEGGARRVVTQALGPAWYFRENAQAADDLRVSPDGEWAIAQITQQLYLYRPGDLPGTDAYLSAPETGAIRLTDVGADYFGWSADGKTLYWSVGSTFRSVALEDIAPARADAERRAVSTDVAVMLPRDQPAGRVLLTGAHVITMADDEDPAAIARNSDILIEGNRIARIAPAGEIAADGETETVDLAGAYVIPGLIDAHYHVADIRRDVLDRHVWGLQANLAFGITTLFDPSSLTIDMLAYQDLIEAGEILGSRLFTTGPAVYDYNDFRTKDQVRSVLTRYKDHYRVSNLKQYRVGNRRVRQWFAEVANELGLTATTEGALSYKFGLTAILDGFSGVEHGIPPMAQYKDFTELYARSGTTSTLTLMITHGGLPADKVFIQRNNAFEDQKYADFVPSWFRETRFRHTAVHPMCDYTFGAVGSNALKLHRAGGIVGMGAHGDIPGLGTQWELQAHVDSGWAPEEALWAATMGSAITIARDESLGSLEAGKLADLVVLEENPITDIRNTQAIRYVMKNGRLYEAGTLTETDATRRH